MATRKDNTGSDDTSESRHAAETVSEAIRDSAQQIWQAGLGAFTRAQIDGSKTFENLVKEGVDIQRKTQAAAEEKIVEATKRMANLASGLGTGANGHWDKLSNIFEDRVARALHVLGVPSAKDFDALSARIDALTNALEKLTGPVNAAADTAAESVPGTTVDTAPAQPATRRAARKTTGSDS